MDVMNRILVLGIILSMGGCASAYSPVDLQSSPPPSADLLIVRAPLDAYEALDHVVRALNEDGFRVLHLDQQALSVSAVQRLGPARAIEVHVYTRPGGASETLIRGAVVGGVDDQPRPVSARSSHFERVERLARTLPEGEVLYARRQ